VKRLRVVDVLRAFLGAPSMERAPVKLATVTALRRPE
jgi:hypothetical protein